MVHGLESFCELFIYFVCLTYIIGGIFHEENSDAEIAFRHAVIRENMYNPKMELIPLIRKIDPTDSFQAEKVACGLASEGVVAIFGPSSIQTYGKLGVIC